MKNDLDSLTVKFNEIKNMGWIKSDLSGTCAIGLTFEKLVGAKANFLEIPDYGEIEIKTKRMKSNSYITLFNATPDSHINIIKYIQTNYGYPDKNYSSYKILNNSVECNFKKKIGIKYRFELKVDRVDRLIKLYIYDVNYNLIENEISWSFDLIEEKINRKLKYLAIILANINVINGIQYFKYETIQFFQIKNFNSFLNALENNQIRVTFKIGINKNEKYFGNTLDHGTGFEIRYENISQIYDSINY